MSAPAFVTGGSGFVGQVLIRRLVADGQAVRALARSERSADVVRDAGAEPVRGDLDDAGSIEAGAARCAVAFHAAAAVLDWGPREEFVKANVTGTRNVLDATRGAGVKRLVHVGTEAALLTGDPLVGADETAPLRPDSKAYYSATKAEAEQLVRAANVEGFETVVLRPRLVWGRGDTTLLPEIASAVKAGRFAWVGGGRHLTSTTHVDNTVEGMVLAAETGRGGEAYFVTDGEPVVFRDFITELLATQGVEAPTRAMPAPLAHVVAVAGEGAWRALRLRGSPPVTRLAYWLSALETTIDISKARTELGYQPVTTIAEGMAALRATAAAGS